MTALYYQRREYKDPISIEFIPDFIYDLALFKFYPRLVNVICRRTDSLTICVFKVIL